MNAALKIKIFGVGGGGCNAVDYMIKEDHLDFLDYIQINTDAQSLKANHAQNKIHIGKELTKGLGAGAVPERGSQSLKESKNDIIEQLKNVKMVFIASGMGGGTGTGAAPELAALAKERGILTISIVTKPFSFEGQKRLEVAENGIQKLRKNSDLVVVIPNQHLVENYPDKVLEDAFADADSVLKDGVRSIIDLLNMENEEEEGVRTFKGIDFQTLSDLIKSSGLGVLGIGEIENNKNSFDENVHEAFNKAIESDLLDISIHGASRILMQITTSMNDVSPNILNELTRELKEVSGTDNYPNYSIKHNPNLPEGFVRVSIVATGYSDERQQVINTTDERAREIKVAQTTKLDINIF